MHLWLLGTYISLLLSRCLLMLFQSAYSLSLRHILACVSFFSFLVLYPFLIGWTAVGTVWFLQVTRETTTACVRTT